MRIFMISIPPNKVCTRRVEFCAIYWVGSGFGFRLLSNILQARQLAGNTAVSPLGENNEISDTNKRYHCLLCLRRKVGRGI